MDAGSKMVSPKGFPYGVILDHFINYTDKGFIILLKEILKSHWRVLGFSIFVFPRFPVSHHFVS